MSEDILDSLWVEKYRPKNLNDVILPDDQKKFFINCVERKDIPSLFFFGPPGSGKSTTARIIVDTICESDMDCLPFNGSDITGVDFIRDEVQEFLKSPPYKSKLKIVFIEEADFLSQNSQSALRAIMEKYSSNGRFMCTGNYISKISDPVQSRFQMFEMKTISHEFAIKYCTDILQKENVEFDNETVNLVVKNFLPDVRKVVNILQQNVINKKLKKIDVNTIVSTEKKVCSLIVQMCDDMLTERKDKTINTNMAQIHKLTNNDLDYRSIYETLFYYDSLPLWAKIKVNQYSNSHQAAIIPSIHFTACVYDIIQSGLSYLKAFGAIGLK
jgi:replication factor C small subunit